MTQRNPKIASQISLPLLEDPVLRALSEAMAYRDKELAERIEELDTWVEGLELGAGHNQNIIDNPGFEAEEADWTEFAGDGSIEYLPTSVHAGLRAAKLTAGALTNTFLTQEPSCSSGVLYTVQFWCRGDGTNAPHYGMYNPPGPVPNWTTGVTSTTWTLFTTSFTPSGATLGIALHDGNANGAEAYFDDILVMPAVTYANVDVYVGQLLRALHQVLGEW